MCPTPLLRNKIYHRHPTATGPSLCRTFAAETTTLETLHGNSVFKKCQLPIINTRVSVWPRPKFCANHVLQSNGSLSGSCGPRRHTIHMVLFVGIGKLRGKKYLQWLDHRHLIFAGCVTFRPQLIAFMTTTNSLDPTLATGKCDKNKIKQKRNATRTHAKNVHKFAREPKKKLFVLALAHDYKIRLFKPQNGKSLTWRDVAMCLGPCYWQSGGDATKLRQIVCFPKQTTYDNM